MITGKPQKLNSDGSPLEQTDLQVAGSTVTHLRTQAGMIQSVRSSIATSREAGRGIREIEKTQIDARVRLSTTAIAITETMLSTAMVTRAVPRITALVEKLNVGANIADQKLTQQEAAIIQSHLLGREQTRTEITRLGQQHNLPDEEIDACKSFADANTADDIARAREGTQAGKQANQNLHDRALAGLQATHLPRNDA